MFCRNCGTQISESTKYCPKCGKEVKQQMSENTYREHVKQPYISAAQPKGHMPTKIGGILLLISGILCIIWGTCFIISLLRVLVPLLSEESFSYLQYGSAVIWVSYNDMVNCLKMGIACNIIILVIGTLGIIWHKKYKMAANTLIICGIIIIAMHIVWWNYERVVLSALLNYLGEPVVTTGQIICLLCVSALMIVGAILNKKFLKN
ncbi:MAG: zinc ribbon domain-containing protein [Clostridiales bacterium]|nr:zinc ribbon domain-containing protein [Clostridiales bacterium]